MIDVTYGDLPEILKKYEENVLGEEVKRYPLWDDDYEVLFDLDCNFLNAVHEDDITRIYGKSMISTYSNNRSYNVEIYYFVEADGEETPIIVEVWGGRHRRDFQSICKIDGLAIARAINYLAIIKAESEGSFHNLQVEMGYGGQYPWEVSPEMFN